MTRTCAFILIAVSLLGGCGVEGARVDTVAARRIASAEPTTPPSPTSPRPVIAATATPEPSATAAPTATPVQWRHVDEETFAFELLSDMERVEVQPIDSQVGNFHSGSMMLNYDFGFYSGDCAEPEAEQFHEQWTRIDERFAHLGYWRGPAKTNEATADRFTYHASLYVPVVHAKRGLDVDDTKLTMSVSGHDPATWEIAQRIFRSVRFAATEQ